MAFPDLRTVLLAIVIEGTICVVVIGSLWSRSRGRSPGVGLWLAAYVIWFTATVVIALRGVIPPVISILAGTPLITGAAILLYIGLEHSTGIKPTFRSNAVLFAGATGIHIYFSVVQPSLLAREMILSGVVIAVCGRGARLLLHRVDPSMRSGTRMAGLVMGAYVAASLARIVAGLTVPPAVDLFASGVYNAIVILAYQALFIALTFSLLLMVNRRLFRELQSDIAERRRTEQALRESEEKFSLAFRTSPHAITITRAADGRFIDLNDSFTAITGYSREEALAGSSIAMGLWVDERDRERAMEDLASGRGVVDRETQFRRKDGRILTALFSAEPIVLSGVPCVVSSLSDITERKRGEEELRKLSAAVEQSPASVIITDLAGNIEYVNPRFSRVTGYSLEDVRGKNPRILKSGDKPAPEYAALWAAITAGQEWRGEFHNRTKTGSLFWEQALIAPIRDDRGAITHFIAVKEDITARKTLESQYLQAQKMETVGRLAGGVAHDFNNMLQVISTYAEMGMKAIEPDRPLHQFLGQIHEAAGRAAGLTGQLLAFARKQTVTPVVLDLNEAVSGMLKMLRRLIGEDIDLAWMPGLDLWRVRIDPSQVDQMLGNLAVNSRDAITGTGKVTIETENSVLDEAFCARSAGCSPGEYVMLAVSDNGCGMGSETLAHVFEPFFTTKGTGKGTGLGTATVYGIVNQNGGFVSVDSEPDKGTTFRIYLPRFRAEDGGHAPAPGREQAEPPRGSETLLILKDEAAILGLAKSMLEGLGYAVLAAGGPQEAIRLAAEHAGEIHLLVTDVVMPGMNGRELAGSLQALRPSLKCLFMSGYPQDVIAHHGVLDAAVSFVQKPFSTLSLATRVREALERK